MPVIKNECDIIILTGCNSVGKTTASNYLREWVTAHKILHERRFIVDSRCLFEVMLLDDKSGGFHHTHAWCEKDSKGHTHNLDKPIFPFTVTDNEMPDSMRLSFFTKLTELPRTGKVWFAEWAAGVNTNPLHDSASIVDYSYAKVKRILQEGGLPSGWLERVYAVIHLIADNSVRFSLNEQRLVPSSAEPEAIEKGTAFWLKDEKVLQFYGRDDFSEIEKLFQDTGIPIYTIENDGGNRFFESLQKIAVALFLPSINKKIDSFVHQQAGER